MVQLSQKNSFKNIEYTLDKLDVAAWVWDADRNRIIAANGDAVSFWQELSVLDLIDTLFGEFHPISLQFSKATGYISDDKPTSAITIDFGSMDIDEKIDCQFDELTNDESRNLYFVQLAAEQATAIDEVKNNSSHIEDTDIIAKMLDNAPAALALFDRHGEFCYANVNCQQIFTPRSEAFHEPSNLSDWFVADENDASKTETIVKNLIEKCIDYKIANISAKLDTAYGARTHSVIAKSFAIKPFNDGEQYVLIYLRDVADERHYEQILVERIAKLEQLTQLGSDFYFILDDELDFVQLGGNFEKLTGYPASELLGENWETVAERFELDPDGVAASYFSDRKSFDNLSISWPVKDTETGLSLTWRGRSIYEQQNGENIFVGSFVTAFENILAISDEELASGMNVSSFSDEIELIEDEDDQDFDAELEDKAETSDNKTEPSDKPIKEVISIAAIATSIGAVALASDDELDDDIEDIDVDPDNIDADLDNFADEEDIAALAELDGATAEDLENEDSELDTPSDSEPQASDIGISTSETDLSEVEAVNFASIGETLSETLEGTAEQDDSVEDVIARSDDVIAEINQILGENDDDSSELASNIVPAFGATAKDIQKFGRTEVDMFKLVLDQTPVMAVVTSLPSEDGIYTQFANKETLHKLGLIEDKTQDLDNDEYANILSVESMEHINSLKEDFSETPLDQEISFLVDGEKQYYNAKISKIDWQNNHALQLILSPKLDLDSLNDRPNHNLVDEQTQDDDALLLTEIIEDNAQDNDVKQFVLDGQAFIDVEQNILTSNIYLNNIVGQTSEDLIGNPLGDIISETDFGAFQNYTNTALQLEEKNLALDGVELELINKTGENHAVFMQIQRLSPAEAKDFPSAILVNIRDISMWKQKEDDLREAKDRAERENVQKSGFLARISHELRTPLNAIIGFSEVMSDEKFGPLENTRYKGYAHDINESGEHLLSLINDLLDLSKVEAGKVELNFKALDLEPLIVQAVSLMQPMADKKRIIIRTSISSTLPQVVADMRSIRQIILNLLSNSIKYSNSGSQVIMSALLNDEGEVIIRVRDTGIGMNETQLATAMEPFKTLDMSTMVDSQGTGLGLPLTKALAEANRADFSIESAENAGTLVQISFPTTRVLNA